MKDHRTRLLLKGSGVRKVSALAIFCLLLRARGLFNAGLDAKATRAIDIGENDDINESALKELVRAAIDYNIAGGKKK